MKPLYYQHNCESSKLLPKYTLANGISPSVAFSLLTTVSDYAALASRLAAPAGDALDLKPATRAGMTKPVSNINACCHGDWVSVSKNKRAANISGSGATTVFGRISSWCIPRAVRRSPFSPTALTECVWPNGLWMPPPALSKTHLFGLSQALTQRLPGLLRNERRSDENMNQTL
jgi:hypothetical protein